MRPVQFAVLRNHFRLNPETEFDANVIYSPNQLAERTSQFFFIHIPVSETAVIVVPFSKPAVIHYDHINAKFRSASGQFQNGLSIETKISGFPTVKQYRSRLSAVFSSAQMLSDAAVISLGQFRQAVSRISMNRLRNDQLFSLCKRIMEILAMQPHNGSCLVILVFLGLEQKIPAVYEYHSVAASEVLGRSFFRQNNCRIILMTGRSPAASNHIAAMSDFRPL